MPTSAQLKTLNDTAIRQQVAAGSVTTDIVADRLDAIIDHVQGVIQTLTDGATITMDVANGKNGQVTIAGNRTFAFSSLVAGDAGIIEIKQDGVGSRTITWPAAAAQPTGGITLSSGAGALTLVGYYYNGVNILLSQESYGVIGGGGGPESIVWSQLVQTTNAGGGTVTGNSATTPAGATATKKITKTNGNYVQFILGATVADNEAVVFVIDNNNDAVYKWGTVDPPNDVVALATAYCAAGDYYAAQDSNAAGTNLGGTPTTGDIVRLEVANTEDVLYKVNGVTIHTYTGALTGVTDLFVKAVFAVNSATKKLETCTGLGLVTI